MIGGREVDEVIFGCECVEWKGGEGKYGSAWRGSMERGGVVGK